MRTNEEIRDAYREQRRQLAETLMALPMTAETITTTATFRVNVDVRMPDNDGLRVERLRVSVDRYLGTEPGVPHAEFMPGEAPHQEAVAWVQPVTKEGKPKAREHAYWLGVPTRVVIPLLGRALAS